MSSSSLRIELSMRLGDRRIELASFSLLRIGFAPSGHRTPLISLKAVPIFCGLDGKPERDFAGAVENLKQMVADETAKLALLSWCR